MALTHCPNGHELTLQRNPRLRYTCDACNKSPLTPGAFLGCRLCDTDYCDACCAEYDAEGFLAKVSNAQEAVRRILGNHREPEPGDVA